MFKGMESFAKSGCARVIHRTFNRYYFNDINYIRNLTTGICLSAFTFVYFFLKPATFYQSSQKLTYLKANNLESGEIPINMAMTSITCHGIVPIWLNTNFGTKILQILFLVFKLK